MEHRVATRLADDEVSPLHHHNADKEGCVAGKLHHLPLFIGLWAQSRSQWLISPPVLLLFCSSLLPVHLGKEEEKGEKEKEGSTMGQEESGGPSAEVHLSSLCTNKFSDQVCREAGVSTIGTQGRQSLPENNRDSESREQTQTRDSDLRGSEQRKCRDLERTEQMGNSGDKRKGEIYQYPQPLHCPHTSVPATHPLLPVAVFQVTDVSVIPGET